MKLFLKIYFAVPFIMLILACIKRGRFIKVDIKQTIKNVLPMAFLYFNGAVGETVI